MKKIWMAFMLSLVLLFMPMEAQAITGTFNVNCAAEATGGAGTLSTTRLQLEAPADGQYADGDYWTTATVSGYLAPGSTYAVGTEDPSGKIMWSSQQTTLGQSIEVDNLDYPPTNIGNLWLQIVSGSGDIYISNATSVQGATTTSTCSSADKAGSGGGTSTGGGTSPPPCNCGCPPAPTPPPPPPIPSPPDPASSITAPKVSQYVPPAPTPPSNSITTPAAQTPQEPPENGVQPFDLNQNQPVINVDRSQSHPITVSDPMKNLTHDDPTTKPAPGTGLASPYTPNESGTATPPVPKQQATTTTTPPVPQQQPTTSTTPPVPQVNAPAPSSGSPTTQGTEVSGPTVSSSDPNPVPK